MSDPEEVEAFALTQAGDVTLITLPGAELQLMPRLNVAVLVMCPEFRSGGKTWRFALHE